MLTKSEWMRSKQVFQARYADIQTVKKDLFKKAQDMTPTEANVSYPRNQAVMKEILELQAEIDRYFAPAANPRNVLHEYFGRDSSSDEIFGHRSSKKFISYSGPKTVIPSPSTVLGSPDFDSSMIATVGDVETTSSPPISTSPSKIVTKRQPPRLLKIVEEDGTELNNSAVVIPHPNLTDHETAPTKEHSVNLFDIRYKTLLSLSHQKRRAILARMTLLREKMLDSKMDLAEQFPEDFPFERLNLLLVDASKNPVTTVSECGSVIFALLRHYPNGGMVPKAFLSKYLSRTSPKLISNPDEDEFNKFMDCDTREIWDLCIAHFSKTVNDTDVVKFSEMLGRNLVPFIAIDTHLNVMDVLHSLRPNAEVTILLKLGHLILNPDNVLVSSLIRLNIADEKLQILAESLVTIYDSVGAFLHVMAAAASHQMLSLKAVDMQYVPSESLLAKMLGHYLARAGRTFLNEALREIMLEVVKRQSKQAYEVNHALLPLKDWTGTVIRTGNFKQSKSNAKRLVSVARSIVVKITKDISRIPRIISAIFRHLSQLIPADSPVPASSVIVRVVFDLWIIPALNSPVQFGLFDTIFSQDVATEGLFSTLQNIAAILDASMHDKEPPKRLSMISSKLADTKIVMEKFVDKFLAEKISAETAYESCLSLDGESIEESRILALDAVKSIILENFDTVKATLRPRDETTPPLGMEPSCIFKVVEMAIVKRKHPAPPVPIPSPTRRISIWAEDLVHRFRATS